MEYIKLTAEDVVENKEEGAEVNGEGAFMGFEREEFYNGVGDKAPDDAVGDAHGTLHDDDGEEGG